MELIDLAKKFVERVEASPHTWQSGYPELAQEFRVAIKTAQHSVHWTLRLLAWLKNNLGLGLRR